MIPVSPYLKKCRYRFCLKDFLAHRMNQYYCCSDHKIRENNWIARQKRQMVNPLVTLQLNNEKVLQNFHKSGKYQVTLQELVGAGYDFSAPTQKLKDAINKRPTQKLFNYGIQA